jgi:hypothetical protein
MKNNKNLKGNQVKFDCVELLFFDRKRAFYHSIDKLLKKDKNTPNE